MHTLTTPLLWLRLEQPSNMNCVKAPDKDSVPTEMCKTLDQVSLELFQYVPFSICEEEIPLDVQDTTTIARIKNKGLHTVEPLGHQTFHHQQNFDLHHSKQIYFNSL